MHGEADFVDDVFDRFVRLHNVIIWLEHMGVSDVGRVAVVGEKDYRHRLAPAINADATGGFMAVHNWHINIEQNDRRFVLERHCDSLLAIFGHLHTHASFYERHGVQFTDILIVFDDEYVFGFGFH